MVENRDYRRRDYRHSLRRVHPSMHDLVEASLHLGPIFFATDDLDLYYVTLWSQKTSRLLLCLTFLEELEPPYAPHPWKQSTWFLKRVRELQEELAPRVDG
jgi:hypothetical protein